MFEEYSPQIRRKLYKSYYTSRGKRSREIRCPKCGLLLWVAVGTDHGFLQKKCRKCKFQGWLEVGLPKNEGANSKDPQNFIMDLNVLDLAKLQMKTRLSKTGLATNP